MSRVVPALSAWCVLDTRRAAAGLILPLLCACASMGDGDFDTLMQRGEAQYAAGQYTQAFHTYDAAAKIVDGRDDVRFIRAAERSGDAFCMMNFSNARRDIAAGDRVLASMSIATALGSPECGKFTDEVNWAREQSAAGQRR